MVSYPGGTSFSFPVSLCGIWEKQGGKDQTLAVTSTDMYVYEMYKVIKK
jgi:hypothetical protein